MCFRPKGQVSSPYCNALRVATVVWSRTFVLRSDLAAGEEKCQSGPFNPTLAIKEPWQCDMSVLGQLTPTWDTLAQRCGSSLDMTKQGCGELYSMYGLTPIYSFIRPLLAFEG